MSVSVNNWRYYRIRPRKAHLWAPWPGRIWGTACEQTYVQDLEKTTAPLTVSDEKIQKCRNCIRREKRRKETPV